LNHGLSETTRFIYELGLLKRYKRTGWLLAGVPDPESIAEHTLRVSMIAAVIAAMEGADPQRAAFLALWHDSQETRTTDLPHLTKRYVTAAPNERVTDDQARDLPEAVSRMLRPAVREYEARQSPEARCARDADKLECLIQAREYHDQGHHNVQPWLDSSLAELQTVSAKQLAHEALAQNSLDWLGHTMRQGATQPSGRPAPDDDRPDQ
jgi:putative hydrolase of HD superfamily